MKNLFKNIIKLVKVPGKPRALPIRGFCDEKDYTWEDWKKEAKTAYPVRYFLSETIPGFYRTNFVSRYSNTRSHLMSKFVHRDHIVNLKMDDYEYGYLDVDNKIHHACFNLLCYFVEVQHKGLKEYEKFVSWQDVDGFPNERREIISIYSWFKFDRPREIAEIKKKNDIWFNKPRSPELMAEINRAEKEFYDKETEMLVNLIKLRKFLWH